jgi:hypothetical protein
MKPIHNLTRPGRLMSALGLAGSLLMAGCGGSDSASPTSGPTEQPASVQIAETASGLVVTAPLSGQSATGAASSASSASAAAGGNETESPKGATSVTQTAQFTLMAAATGGANLLQGTLALRAESEDAGATELEGRFVPAAATAAAAAATPSADALAAFQTAKIDLKAKLRAAVEQLRTTYDAAVAADPAAKSTARAAFKAAVATAMNTFRADLATAAAAAGVTLSARGEGAKSASNGSEVEGTLDPTSKALALTIRQRGGQAKIVLTGTGSLDAGFAGTFTTTVDGAAVTGDWSATPSAVTVPTVPLPPVTPPVTPPAPPPPVPAAADCTAQAVTWSVGSASCSANFAGGASGSSAKLSNLLSGTTGSVTASCNNGVVTKTAPQCSTSAPAPVPVPPPAPPPPPATGDVVAGLAVYNGNCSGCHGTSKASAPAASTVAGLTSVLNSVGSHAGFKAALLAQPKSLLDLSAYIASKK